MLFRHLTHAACRMPVGLSAQFNRLALRTHSLSLSGKMKPMCKSVAYFMGATRFGSINSFRAKWTKLLPTFWGSLTPPRLGSMHKTVAYFFGQFRLALHAHTIKIGKKKLNQSANRLANVLMAKFICVRVCGSVCVPAYWICRHAQLEIRLCNCNGVLKIYIIAENIVETCLIEFLWALLALAVCVCAWFLLAVQIIS